MIYLKICNHLHVMKVQTVNQHPIAQARRLYHTKTCFLDLVGANRNLRVQLACCEIHENYVLVGPHGKLPDYLDVFWHYSSMRMCNCMWVLFYLDEFRHSEAILFLHDIPVYTK